MKRILLLTAMICAYGINTTFAQTNLDLEAWSPIGVGAENPDGWGSLNEFTLFGFPASTFKETTDPGEGLASVKLESAYMDGATLAGAPSDTVGGMLFLGVFDITTFSSGVAFAQKPVSVDFIYKANPLGNDMGVLVVELSHYDVLLDSTITDGQGIMTFGSQVNTWAPASICITYFTADVPDTLKIFAASSAVMIGLLPRGMEMPGSQLFLDDFSINLPGALAITFTAPPTNVDCNGNCNGVLSIAVTNGTPNYIYSWTNGDNTDTADSLCAGMYSVFVTDGVGDKACLVAPITEPAMALTATVGSTDETAMGANDGTASASASGGSGTLVYSWNTTPPQTTDSISGLAPGDYTVTVTDTNSCTVMQTVTVSAFTGIKGIDGNANIKVYPNPAVNELNIATTFNEETVFDIFDIVGRQIKSIAIRGDITRVNIAELPEGMYLYQINNDKGAVLSLGKFNIVR